MDLAEIGYWSRKEFGRDAASRYVSLIRQAIRDVARDPERPGSKQLEELRGEGFRAYHLAFSRPRITGRTVKSPRHFLVYRYADPKRIEVVRILHDSRDLVRHVPLD